MDYENEHSTSCICFSSSSPSSWQLLSLWKAVRVPRSLGMNPRNATLWNQTLYTIACRIPSGSAVPHCPLRRGTTRPERHVLMLFRWDCVRWGFRGSTCRPARATQAPAPAYTIASIQQLTQLCAIIKCFALCAP